MGAEMNSRHAELVAWLTEDRHSPEEIDRILAKVEEYETQIIKGSIFDSIDRGEFDLTVVIKQALGET